jgi:hypothetical protein
MTCRFQWTAITASNNGAEGLSKRATGSDFAVLSIPEISASTNVVTRNILLAFNNVPFAATSESLFSKFLLDTTQGTSLALGLHGSANSKFSLSLLRYRDCGIDLISMNLQPLL